MFLLALFIFYLCLYAIHERTHHLLTDRKLWSYLNENKPQSKAHGNIRLLHDTLPQSFSFAIRNKR
jgi:hypothetical protein